jgi:uncharacterized damage-inducible protein DinB
MTSNPFDILLAHDRWATEQILQACAGLTPEQFNRPFEMGRGSLHNTVAHLLAAMRAWNDMLNGREPGPRIDSDGKQHTAGELLSLLNEIAAEFSASARAHPLDGIVTRVRDGKTYTFTRGGVVTHVATHGMHHRAQCLNMLRHVGVKPLPPSSVLEWMNMVDSRA